MIQHNLSKPIPGIFGYLILLNFSNISMTFAEAKTKFKNEYIKVGFELVDEHEEELSFTFREYKFKISKEEMEGYIDVVNATHRFEELPAHCGLINKDYREQIVAYSDSKIKSFLTGRRLKYTFGEKNDTDVYAEITPASNIFINYFRFEELYLEYWLNRTLYSNLHSSEENKPRNIVDTLYRPITIKIYNLNESSVKTALAKSDGIIDGCIFSLSALKTNPIVLIDEWPTRRRRLKNSNDYEFGEKNSGNILPIPKLKLNPVLVRFHQQATSTDIASLKYLAFYQILEFFFLSVSDENLYTSLSRRINDLKFQSIPQHLDKIIQDVVSHKRENDETEMLKNVLKKYVDENEVILFINDYEKFLSRKVYSNKRSVFGVDIASTEIKVGHVFGNISKSIKAVRNALVHSSDRHERNDRYIPYSKEGTELIELELPLIKFLADKIIIASASPL